MVDEMQKQNDFETACKNMTEEIGIFKEEIVSKCVELQDAEWSSDKGTTRFARLMKTARRSAVRSE